MSGPGATAGGMTPTQPAHVLRGILFMCLAVSLFPFLNASVKLLSGGYETAEIVWARYAGHLLYMLLVLVPFRGRRLFRTARPLIQIARSVLLFGATAFYFSALGFISLPLAAMIGFTGPLIVTALARPMLDEDVGVRRWAAVIAGFIGAVIILRPGLGGTHWAALLVLGSATCYALYQVLTRKIAAHDTAETTITYTAVVGVVVASGGLLFVDVRLPAETGDWLLFLGLGVFGGLGHYFVVKAYQWAPAPVISPFGYGQLVGATALGFFLFGDFPDLGAWIGAAVIVASGIYITYREGLRREARAANG